MILDNIYVFTFKSFIYFLWYLALVSSALYLDLIYAHQHVFYLADTEKVKVILLNRSK